MVTLKDIDRQHAKIKGGLAATRIKLNNFFGEREWASRMIDFHGSADNVIQHACLNDREYGALLEADPWLNR